MKNIETITSATETDQVDKLSGPERPQLLSANFCEAMYQLRPLSERSTLTVIVDWSKTAPRPQNELRTREIRLRHEHFEVIQYVAQSLRKPAEAKLESFAGYVDALRGQADIGGEMSGEVKFALAQENSGFVRARAVLDVENYRIAGEAHLNHQAVFLQGYLKRLPRNNVIKIEGPLRTLGPNDIFTD